MRTQETYDATLEELERLVGIKYVKAFHLNDSKEGLGKHRDLHENIGQCLV
jgi:AP endonuclease-1